MYALLERAALQEHTAEMAAEVALEAERTGQNKTSEVMWEMARRCHVRALKLRADAVAQRGERWRMLP